MVDKWARQGSLSLLGLGLAGVLQINRNEPPNSCRTRQTGWRWLLGTDGPVCSKTQSNTFDNYPARQSRVQKARQAAGQIIARASHDLIEGAAATIVPVRAGVGGGESFTLALDSQHTRRLTRQSGTHLHRPVLSSPEWRSYDVRGIEAKPESTSRELLAKPVRWNSSMRKIGQQGSVRLSRIFSQHKRGMGTQFTLYTTARHWKPHWTPSKILKMWEPGAVLSGER